MYTRLASRAACAATLFAAVAAPQRIPDTRLTTAPPGAAYADKQQLSTADDHVYVVWRDSRNGMADIYLDCSLDGGASWQVSDTRINQNSIGTWRSDKPQICSDGSSVYVVWEGNDSSVIYFNRSTDSGATWQASDTRLDTDTTGSLSTTPRICSDGSNLYVVWQDLRHGSGVSDIYFNHSTDAGATWQASDTRLNTDPPGTAGSVGPLVASFGQNVYVVWEDFRNTQGDETDIYFNHSDDGGVTWQAVDTRLDTDAPGAANSSGPQIGCHGDSVYVVWHDSRNGPADIYFNRSTDRGATWQAADTRLDTDPGTSDSSEPQLCIEPGSCLIPPVCTGDQLYVVWADRRNGVGSDVYFTRSADGGATWLTSDLRLDHAPPGASSSSASLACESGSVYVAWQDSRDGPLDIYFTRSPDGGATFLTTDVRLDTGTPTGESGLPRLAASNGAVFAVWRDHRHGGGDIYFNVPFGLLPYGSGKAGGFGIPSLVARGTATLGSPVTLDVAGGAPSALGQLLVGAAGSKIAAPLLGGTLLVLPTATLLLQLDGSGAWTLPLRVPNQAAFLGRNVNVQAILVDPGATFGLSFTNAVEMWAGVSASRVQRGCMAAACIGWSRLRGATPLDWR